MQTFLPYPNFRRSLESLDRDRLGKQRGEVKQMLNALFGIKRGYRNHTATKMWVGHTDALAHYGLCACEVWMERGYKDDTYSDIYGFLKCDLNDFTLPPWFGSRLVHSSHRARLKEKDGLFYSKFSWAEPPAEGYFWPSATYDWRTKIGDGLDPYYNPSYVAGKA